MLIWERLDPKRFERAVQMLLRRLYPGLVSLDGAGGDGGKDAQLIAEDGRTVFEIKSFCGRITSSRRRQVEKSLRTAVANAPNLSTWVLVVPVNRTPSRQGSKSSEEAWFEDRLQACAPGVKLEWWGQDWLDSQFAEYRDLRRYAEGEEGELLRLAGEHQLEQAVLANGGRDLVTRTSALRDLVDEISPHWTLDWSVEGNTYTRMLRAKTPDAAALDPVVLKPTFVFDPQQPEAVKLRERFEDVMRFGGSVTLPPENIADFRLDASPEVRRLMGDVEGVDGTLEYHSVVQELDKPLRGQLQVLDGPGGAPVASVDIFFRSRTAGTQGPTLMGGDAGEALRVSLKLPRPDSWDVAQIVTGGALDIDIADLTEQDLVTALPILALKVAAIAGRCFRVKFSGLAPEGPVFTEDVFPGREDFLEVGRVVRRLEELLDSRLRLPREVDPVELAMARAAVRSLEGEQAETPYDTFPVNVKSDCVQEFLAQLPGETFAMRTSNVAYELRLGDLVIPYGPCVMLAPAMTLQNREELEGHRGDTSPVARFTAAGQPIYLVARALAEEVCAADATRDEAGPHPVRAGDNR